MNCWQLPKNCAHCGEVRNGGISGYPILHVGGEHEAVTAAAPGEDVESEQFNVQPDPRPTTAGCDEVHVNGVFVNTTGVSEPATDVLPTASTTRAFTFSAVPLVATKLV